MTANMACVTEKKIVNYTGKREESLQCRRQKYLQYILKISTNNLLDNKTKRLCHSADPEV